MGKKGAQPSAQLPLFEDGFWSYYAGRLISDQQVAIVELVANAWDAGADRVEITWPLAKGEDLAVADNGTGMTHDQFLRRWRALNYNRREAQGSEVEFPPGVRDRKRLAFGRSGIGRHAMFCFASEYVVETRRDGKLIGVRVRRASGGETPFDVDVFEQRDESGHGTRLSARSELGLIPADAVRELIGARFVADPDFQIFVNGSAVTLTDLEHRVARSDVAVEGFGVIAIVSRYDMERPGRTSKQHGIAWWVRRRLVGTPSWDGPIGSLIDARRGAAKRFTYVVEADFLEPEVKADWTGFRATPRYLATEQAVADFVAQDLRALTSDERRERKRTALETNKVVISQLPPISQEAIASFAEQVQLQCPRMEERDLNNAVTVLANLEKARSGYDLLEKLAAVKPDDLDGLNSLLEEWTISDAKRVLGELRRRMMLIVHLEKRLDDSKADELHELQPLFERGLWIFGPAFEAIDFTSNQTLATVVEKFFGEAALTTPRKRPDFVVLPDTSIGVYSQDAYDDKHEVCGFSAIVVVELKKSGFTITGRELNQAMEYSREIRSSGLVGKAATIEGYVLGSRVDPAIDEPMRQGTTTIRPMSYAWILRQAHARTFHLMKRIQSTKKWGPSDEDLTAIVDSAPLFEGR